MRSHSAFHLQVSLSRAPRWRCLRATLTGILVSPGLVWQAWAANKAQKDQAAARAPEREGAGFKLSGPTHVPNHPAPPSHSSQAGEREGLAVRAPGGAGQQGGQPRAEGQSHWRAVEPPAQHPPWARLCAAKVRETRPVSVSGTGVSLRLSPKQCGSNVCPPQ